MAVEQVPDAFSMVLTLEITDKDGKPANKKYTYPKLRQELTPEQIFDAALAFEKLHKDPLLRVNLISNHELYKS